MIYKEKLPSNIFNSVNNVTTQDIDNFLFGGKKSEKLTEPNNLVSTHISPNDYSELDGGLEEGDEQVTAVNNALIVATDSVPGDQIEEDNATPPSQSPVRSGAYGQMEVAAVGSGKKSRNDITGARSFINPYAIIHHAACKDANDFLDIEDRNGAYPKVAGSENRRELTLEGLLNDFPSNGKNPSRLSTPFRLGDFLYAKYYGKIPLNNMIVLRRFAHPTYDNLTWGKYNNNTGSESPSTNSAVPNSSGEGKGESYNYKPIAQAVTYFGESTGNDLEKISAIKGEIKWKQLEADVNKYEMDDSNGVRGAESTPFAGTGFRGATIAGLARGVSILNGTGDTARRQQVDDGNRINLFEAHWANKTYGPVDSITQTQIRDRGVHATYKVDLTFEFELRSIADINPRIAMLDIIANMLALTFNNAKFWGGANIFFPNHPQFSFLGNQKDYYNGDYGKYLDSVFKDMGTSMGKGLDILKSLASSILNLDFKSAINQIAKSIGGTVMDLQAAKSRPATMAVKSLLTGQPNGCWHLTVGNPYRPIMKMGNLIVKEWEMNFGGFVGVDDFPTEMKYRVTLETCRPVDKGGVESWLNGVVDQRSDGLGSGRLYYPSKTMVQGVTDKYKDYILTNTATGQVTGVKDQELYKAGKTEQFNSDIDDVTHIIQSQGSLF